MPIDPNIALQVRQPQFESPLRSAGQAMQLRGLMGQQEMQGLQMAEMRRAQEERTALRALLAEGGDMATLPERLMRGGHVEAGLKFQKANLDNRKTTADIGKTELEAGALATKTFADTMAGVTDQASYQGAMSALAQNPAFVPMLKQLPQQWTPEFGQQAVRQAMIAHGKIADTLAKNASRDIGGTVQTVRTDPITGAEQVVGEIAKTSTPDALMRDATTRSEGAAGRGVTMRGQNMTDARSAETNRINRDMPRGIPTQAPDGSIVLVDPRGGLGRPALGVDGKPMKGVPTESQANAGTYVGRMESSDKIMRELETTISTTGLAVKQGIGGIPVIGGGAESSANFLLSANQQKVEQAQRDFLNATLRKESGAVISKEEFANGRQQYFPMPGDTQAVIEQKRANRANAIRGIRVAAGPARPEAAVVDDPLGVLGGGK
jgi:hypothetical protein